MNWIIISVIGLIILWKIFTIFVFPKILARWFTLHHRICNEDGYVAIKDLSGYIGKEGLAITALRPCGKVCFGDEKIDAMSEREFIPPGTPIKVVQIRNGGIVVSTIRAC